MQNAYMGVDGCRGGWLAIQLSETGDWIVALAQSNHELAALIERTQLTLIDIPIGLLDSGGPQRECDRLARKALTMPRAASVFSVPCRHAVYANSYFQASKLNNQLLGKKLSKQTWNITPKIRQIDELLQSKTYLRKKLQECHPEVCFWALNNKISMRHNKKLTVGREERMQVLMRFYPKAQHILDYSIEKFRRKQVAIDDIIDAMGLAITALLGYKKLSCFPNVNLQDTTNTSMQIVYWDPSSVIK